MKSIHTNSSAVAINRDTNRWLVILLLLFSFCGFSQVYPVQVTTVTTPPYYNYLAHYGDQNNHLQIIATFTDFAAPPVNVRLRLTIEGPGYVLRTRQDLPVGQLYTLSPGVPVFIQGSDLLPYLTENNLEFISGNVDLDNLPEGFTTMCAEVVKDGINGEVLSAKACTAFFLQYMQPPQAFLPICSSTVDTTQLFQTFQWSPPQNYLPSVGSDLTYNFSLYEWIDTTNYNIFQSGQGLVYQTQTTFPMVQVSNFDVLWQTGRKYVWRVQAQLTSNGLPIQMFNQNGLSAPCSFYYGHAQSLAESLTGGLTISVTAEALASRKGRALWTVTDETPGEGLSNYTSYIVEYRRKPYAGENYTYNWLSDTVYAQQQPIWRLEPEETYQVRVSGVAGDFVSEPSDITEFTTPPLREYACGEADLPYLSPNYAPLLSAGMGDVFQIGQFELEVTYIEPLGQVGHYRGRGLIKHDFIGGAKVKVKFDDLLVDNQFVVREGMATAITKGVDDWLNDEYLDLVDPIEVNGVIESGGFVNDTTVFVVVNGDSLFFEFDGVLPIVIHGDNNVEYQFWPDGTVVITTYGIIASNDQLDATQHLYVHFEEAPNQAFGFDKKQYAQFNDNYEIIVCQDQFQYVVPNQSKSTTGTTPVKAVIHGTIPNFQLSELTFELAGGHTQVPYTRQNDSTFLLTLPERSYDYMVYAIYADLKLGKLNVKSYVPLTKKVRIVPLTTSQLSETQIEAGLNSIFKGANLTLDVTIAPVFSTPEFTASTVFQNPDATAMSKYTAQMRALRTAFLTEHSLEENEYLVFIINEFENSNIDGYMVRGRGLGFIAQSTLSSVHEFTRTLAHELGHGMGGLQHVWGDNESLKGTTNNLLDYSDGSKLIKNQWTDLHNPGVVVSLLDGEENGLALNSLYKGIESENVDQFEDYDEVHLANYLNTDQFVFRAENGLYFKLGSAAASTLESVYLRNGYAIAAKAGSKHYYLCTRHFDFVTNSYGNSLFFYSDEDNQRYDDVPTTNGDTISVIRGRSDDITTLEHISCSQVQAYLADVFDAPNSTPPSDSLIFLEPQCPPSNANDANCEVTYYQTVSNLDKQFMRDLVATFVWNNDPIKAFFRPGHENYTYFSEMEELMIKEKVKALKELRPNTAIGYVLFENADPDKLFSPQQLNEMAADAVQHAKLANPDKDIALLLYNMPFYIESGYYTHHDNCYNIGFAVSSPSMIKPAVSTEDVAGGTALEVFQEFFALLKKPYKIINVHERFNGEIVLHTYDKTEPGKEVYGSPFIYKANYLISTYRDQYNLKLNAIGTANSHYEQGMDNPSNASTLAQQQLLAEEAYLVAQAEQAFNTSVTEWESLESLDDYQDWLVDEDMSIFLDNIKESYLTEQVVLSELKDRKGDDIEWLNELDVPTNPTTVYYDYNEFELLDQIIYGVIDVMGCIPLVDFVADGAGVLYSAIRGNGTNVVIYSSALATPFVGGYILKQGHKTVAYFIKKVDNMTYQLAAKNLDEVISPEWLKISDDVPVDAPNVTHALNDLNSPQNLNKFTPNDRKAAYEFATHQLSWIDNLVAELPSGAKPKIIEWINDGLDNTKLQAAFEGAANKTTLFNNLNNANGIYHRMEIIGAYEDIPGVTFGTFPQNMGSNPSDVLYGNKTWEGTTFDLPLAQVQNFSGSIRPVELNAGEKIYRVSSENGASGPWWVFEKDLPDGVGDVIGGTAVRPSWNNFKVLYEYEVPEGVTIKCWVGNAAPQRINDNVSNYFLSGGTEQIFIPFINQQDVNFSTNFVSNNTNW